MIFLLSFILPWSRSREKSEVKDLQDIFQSCLRMILICLLPSQLASSASLGLNLVKTYHLSSTAEKKEEAKFKSVLQIR